MESLWPSLVSGKVYSQKSQANTRPVRARSVKIAGVEAEMDGRSIRGANSRTSSPYPNLFAPENRGDMHEIHGSGSAHGNSLTGTGISSASATNHVLIVVLSYRVDLNFAKESPDQNFKIFNMTEKITVDLKESSANNKAGEVYPKNELAVQYSVDPREERGVVGKLDRVIMPLMALVYFFQYLDKGSINYASVFGLTKDLKLSGVEFSWAISLFYFGQLCSEYPAIYLMSRFPITIFVGITIVLWGGAEMSMAASKNFSTLAATRFLLGFFEGAVSPSFMIITSNWYRRQEHPVRVAIWVSMNGVSNIVGGLMMYGLGQANVDISNWRLMFLVCGGLTIFAGGIFLIAMPRDTTNAWFLKPIERKIATERLALDRATRDHSSFNWGQAKEALLEPRTILYVLMAFFIMIPTPIQKFSSLVIQGFGYTRFQTMLVGLPGGAFQIITIWAGALIPRYLKVPRSFVGIGLAAVPLLGAVLLLAMPARASWGIVVATWMAACNAAPYGTALQLMASNVRGNTKKSTIGALFFISYCVGAIIGPQMWQSKDAPRYSTGCIASIISCCGLIVTYWVYYVVSKRANAARDKQAEEEGEVIDESTTGIVADADITELQDRGFRYTL